MKEVVDMKEFIKNNEHKIKRCIEEAIREAHEIPYGCVTVYISKNGEVYKQQRFSIFLSYGEWFDDIQIVTFLSDDYDIERIIKKMGKKFKEVLAETKTEGFLPEYFKNIEGKILEDSPYILYYSLPLEQQEIIKEHFITKDIKDFFENYYETIIDYIKEELE